MTSLTASLLFLISNIILPLCLCTFCSPFLQYSFLGHLHGLFPHFLVISVQMPPYHPNEICWTLLNHPPYPAFFPYYYLTYALNIYFLSVTPPHTCTRHQNLWSTRARFCSVRHHSPVTMEFFMTKKMMKTVVLLPNLVSRSTNKNIPRGCGRESGNCTQHWGTFHLMQAEFPCTHNVENIQMNAH